MMVADEVYANVGSAGLRYDGILQEGKPAPAIVCIHGGGWVSGDRSDMHEVAQYFAQRGFSAFCPQYRLAPLYSYPAPIEDIATFISYLREKVDSLGILPNAIGVIGNSAGGYLAAMAGLAADENERANAVVDICGLTDLTNYRESHPPISWDFLVQYMSGAAAEDPSWIEASPLFRVHADAPPYLIFHGQDDDVVYLEQSKRFYDSLREAGVNVELEVLPGEGHSFTLPAFEKILQRSTEFFDMHLGARIKETA
jgi:acetyl esterase/lipase